MLLCILATVPIVITSAVPQTNVDSMQLAPASVSRRQLTSPNDTVASSDNLQGFVSPSNLEESFFSPPLPNAMGPGRQLGELPSSTPPYFSLGLVGEDYINMQVSRCASLWNTVLGNYTFLDGTSSPSTTWAMIWNDAGTHSHDKDGIATGFNYALYRSVANYLAVTKPSRDAAISAIHCANGTEAVTAGSEGLWLKDELRRRRQLLQLPISRLQATILYTVIPASTVVGLGLAFQKTLNSVPQMQVSPQA
ncbi:MAG: hypothetical protein M1828_001996 [Chrysothrix sp. TS-e1954]|nr:MAG: hypothetical protein M1828_001996 [Chrysothrix sp. TS-e1954]